MVHLSYYSLLLDESESQLHRVGTAEAVTYAPIMLASNPIIAVMVSLPVQLFVAWRIKVLNQSTALPVTIAIFSVTSFVGGIANSVLITIIRKYINFPRFEFVSIIWVVTSAAADILITATLVFNLLRRPVGIGSTDHVNRIIHLTVQTGFITAVFAILNAVIFMSIRGRWTLSFIYDFSLSKLYSNSLLFTLNTRCGWKRTTPVRDNVLFGNEAVGLKSPRDAHK
ncbi:hypothetical protein JVU11DRAFT_7164 [Chiua virens]|nr:hypothetical protein JVU11DRAFT_7164 [Chiua virens]